MSPEDQTMAAERNAGELLERLMHRLGSEQLDYHRHHGLHKFSIDYGGARFKMLLTDEALARRSGEFFEEAVSQILRGMDAQRHAHEAVTA
jgi:hypothetical protein